MINRPGIARVLGFVPLLLLLPTGSQAQECTRVNDRGAEVRLPTASQPLQVQHRSDTGTWRNRRNVTETELYLGNLPKGEAVELRSRPEGAHDWAHTWSCDPEPERTDADSWHGFMAAIDTQPFEIYGLEDAAPALARALGGWGAAVRERGEHLVVSDHNGAMDLLPRIVFEAGRRGVVPRFGIDGHGDPGALSTGDRNEYRAFFDLIAQWSLLPQRPEGTPDPDEPVTELDPLVPSGVNPAPDGGGWPDDGTGLGASDEMCKYLTCEPFSCGQPPLPAYDELKDCSGLQDQLDELADQIDYWNEQGQFWLDAVRYLDLAIQGKATAEMGVQVSNMASALALVLTPEPISTVSGIVLAATTFGTFAMGQLMDAIGVCGSSPDCSMGASKAAAEAQVQAILDLVVQLRLEAREARKALFECLGERARQQQALQDEIAEFEEAMDAYEACRENQVCEWRSRPCG